MITEDEVVAAYRSALKAQAHRMEVEQTREETEEEALDRQDAVERHDTLQLQYLSQCAGADDSYIDVSAEGVATLVNADGTREPAPEGWDNGSAIKAIRLG